MKTTKRYRVREFARNRWEVIAPDGIPLYDGAPYGKDKPLIFKDEDEVFDYVNGLNETEHNLNKLDKTNSLDDSMIYSILPLL